MTEQQSEHGSQHSYRERAEEAFREWRENDPTVVAIDTETTGRAYADTAFCATVAWDRDDGDYTAHYFELSDERAHEVLSLIMYESGMWVFHNAKFDLQKLIEAGVISREEVLPTCIADTEAIAHLLDEQQLKGLKPLAVEHLDWTDVIEVPYKSGPRAKTGETRKVSAEKHAVDAARRKLKLTKVDGYDKLPREVIIPYAISDARLTLGLYDHLWPQLLYKDEDLLALYQREMKLALVLLDVEAAGMAVDLEYVNKTVKELSGQMLRTELEIQGIVGEPWKDHHTYIMPAFEKLGIKAEDSQKGTLKELDHPFAKAILEWRRVKKLRDYFLAIQEENIDGILHPNFRQHGTKTGRMSSGEAED
jgi:DNA polymerase I-like protein with 3'-5' exonuclease and polymerase domains